jgi:HEAT repeats
MQDTALKIQDTSLFPRLRPGRATECVIDRTTARAWAPVVSPGGMAVIYYCPSCWSEVGDASVCPVCGADVRGLAGEAYEQKLIRALHHPEPTVPVRAATILGELGSATAVQPLVEVALSSTDPYLQEAAVTALGSIGDRRALPCVSRLSREGGLRVREAARRALRRFEDTQHATRS